MIKLAVLAEIISDSKILLLKRAKTGLWGFPGGKVKIGESFENGLIREIGEETGIIVRKNDLRIHKAINHLPDDKGIIWSVVIFRYYLTKKVNITVNDEHSKYMWAKTDELPTNLFRTVAYLCDDPEYFLKRKNV